MLATAALSRAEPLPKPAGGARGHLRRAEAAGQVDLGGAWRACCSASPSIPAAPLPQPFPPWLPWTLPHRLQIVKMSFTGEALNYFMSSIYTGGWVGSLRVLWAASGCRGLGARMPARLHSLRP